MRRTLKATVAARRSEFNRTAMQPFPKPADAHPKRERHGDIVFGELCACWDLRPEAVAAGRRLFGAHWEETPGPAQSSPAQPLPGYRWDRAFTRCDDQSSKSAPRRRGCMHSNSKGGPANARQSGTNPQQASEPEPRPNDSPVQSKIRGASPIVTEGPAACGQGQRGRRENRMARNKARVTEKGGGGPGGGLGFGIKRMETIGNVLKVHAENF